MSLVVDQLVYTSFPKIGFQCLTSANIPVSVQEFFYQEIISQFWNAYNPPEKNYKGAYLYQVATHQTLFGWLYNNEVDDFGRINVPYFHCYYLTKLLDKATLDKILDCLETELFHRIDRKNPPKNLLSYPIPNISLEQAINLDILIPIQIRQQSYRQIQQQTLIQWFVPSSKVTDYKIFNSSLSSEQIVVESNPENGLIMNSNKTDKILQELANKPIGIQGVILVSSDGQPLTQAIGFDENSALVMAGTMLYLAKSTQEEFSWKMTEQVAIRGKEGHVILTACNADTFLLIKAGKAITGLLEGEIQRTVKKLQTALESPEILTPQPTVLPQLTAQYENNSLPQPQPLPMQEVLYDVVPEIEEEPEEEIRYRGRSTK